MNLRLTNLKFLNQKLLQLPNNVMSKITFQVIKLINKYGVTAISQTILTKNHMMVDVDHGL